MKVALYTGAVCKEGSGIQVYVRDLLDAMVRSYPDADLTLIHNLSRCALKDSDYSALSANIRVVPLYVPESYAIRLWSRRAFPYVDQVGPRFDIVHSATSYMPPIRHARKVVTVHDLACVTHPDKLIISELRAQYTIETIKTADLVIAVSEHTRQQIVRLLGIAKEKVFTVYSGIDPLFLQPRSELDDSAVMRRYGIDYPYILFVGNIDPRKNIRGLITAYAMYARRHQFCARLIIAGKETSQAANELAVIDELGVQDMVDYLGYVPRGDLPALYARARVFIFPSFLEGFGFPVLEAMSCGTPVIVSDTSALPEVAGNAAYYVAPGSEAGIAKALLDVMTKPRLRDSMIKKGLERARMFRWERTARETMACYRTLLDRD